MAEQNSAELKKLYGISEGYTCKHCTYLLRTHHDIPYLKCTKARITRSHASDWRAGWQACGLYKREKP